MTLGDIGSYIFLNSYDVPYHPLKFVLWIQRHPVYNSSSFANGFLEWKKSFSFLRAIERKSTNQQLCIKILIVKKMKIFQVLGCLRHNSNVVQILLNAIERKINLKDFLIRFSIICNPYI